jgi:hypothetical protein
VGRGADGVYGRRRRHPRLHADRRQREYIAVRDQSHRVHLPRQRKRHGYRRGWRRHLLHEHERQLQLRQQGTGGRNTAVGVGASAWNGNGGQNTAIGMYSNATGNSNNRGVFLGYASGYYETADDRLWIDNRPRASNADGRLKALVYGVFDALTTNQLFRVNGQIESPEGDLGLRILTADAVHMPAFRGRQITGSGVATLILTSSYGLFVINNVNTGAQALVLHSYSGDVIVSQSAENEFVLGAPGAGKTGLITTAHNLTLQASAATTGNLFGASMMAPSTV